MKQEYFVVVLAHSLRGRLRRIHIPHQAVYAILALALLGCFSVFGFVASYARMAWKVANYNALRKEADGLRSRYQNLQKVVNQTNEQLASLRIVRQGSFHGVWNQAETGRARGYLRRRQTGSHIRRKPGGLRLPSQRQSAGLAGPPLRAVSNSTRTPNLWPVEGDLTGSYGSRSDPFSGEGGEFHQGVDICAPIGTTVRATADGIVTFAAMEGGYGRLIRIEHGGGISTYYAISPSSSSSPARKSAGAN